MRRLAQSAGYVPNLLITSPSNSGERCMTAATDCHETVMECDIKHSCSISTLNPNSPGFSDEPGLFSRQPGPPVSHCTVMFKTPHAR